ncbi:MAG: TIGR04063 family PEP-CTERM/XrtA system glycosyltransferase [Terriglobia bacterium]
MRILHVLDHSIPLQSGYSFRTHAILREQRRMGWTTLHLTSPKQGTYCGPEEVVDELRFYRTPSPSKSMVSIPLVRELALIEATGRKISRLVGEMKPDIIQAHSPVLNALPAIRVGRRTKIPVVYEVRAFWEDAAVDHGTTREGRPRYRLTRALETFAMRNADHVTTICEGLRQDIVKRGIPEARVSVIPNAVDLAAFEFDLPPDLGLKGRLGLDGKIVIGFIGSFYAYEGLDLLLSAMPQVLRKIPEARVLLAGGGPQEPALRSLARDLGMGDKVVFTGRVPHSEIPRYYGIVDVLTYPRHSMRLTELVTPLKPLEAMARGRLVLASDVGGHRELIRDGETGILFRAGDTASLVDAIAKLFGDRDSWPRIRQQARSFVEAERNWTASVARYRPVFEALKRAG